MKTLLLIFLLFVSVNLDAQEKGMVLITGDMEHTIKTPDSLSQAVIERWRNEMHYADVDYQSSIRNINEIIIIQRDRDFVYKIKDGIIYLNKELNEFPNCKKAVIVQALYVNNGGKVDKEKRVSVFSNFRINKRNDELFKKQFSDNYLWRNVKLKLEE